MGKKNGEPIRFCRSTWFSYAISDLKKTVFIISYSKEICNIGGRIIMKITESQEFAKIKEDYEKKATKAAAKKIVREQTGTAILEEITDSRIARLSQKANLAEKNERYEQKMGKVDLQSNLSKASLPLLLFATIASLLSVFMSCGGVSYSSTPSEIVHAATGKYWLPVWLMATFEVSIIVYSLLSYGFSLYYRKINKYMGLFRVLVFCASVYSNHMFLVNIIPDYETTASGRMLGWFFAAGADIVSNLFSMAAICLKYRLYDQAENVLENQNVGYFTKILICLTAKIRLKIDQSYVKNVNMLNEFYRSNKKGRQSKTLVNTVNTVNTSVYDGLQTSDKQVDMQKEAKNENITYYKHLVPNNIEVYEKQLDRLPVGAKLTRDMFGLDAKEWRQVRDYWVRQGLVQCVDKATYKAG